MFSKKYQEIQKMPKMATKWRRIFSFLVLLFQVDAHNVVPVWETSDKQEYAARTIRNKVTSKLDKFLTDFPPVVKHDIKPTSGVVAIKFLFVCFSNSLLQPVSKAFYGGRIVLETSC